MMEERQGLDERKIRELFRQTGESIQAVLDYFRLANKKLWAGSAGKGKTITVPNLSKYQIIRVKMVYGEILADASAGVIRLVYGDRAGSSDTQVTGLLFANVSGNSLNILNCNWVAHTPSGSHGAVNQTEVKEVWGIVPLLPDSLKKIAGGG